MYDNVTDATYRIYNPAALTPLKWLENGRFRTEYHAWCVIRMVQWYKPS